VRLRRLWPLLLVVPTLALAGSSPAGPLAHGGVIETSFRSRAVRGVVRMAVYLPPGYASGALRYPVVYFFHGDVAHTPAEQRGAQRRPG
jgi:enterochelin esterase-like enzyme